MYDGSSEFVLSLFAARWSARTTHSSTSDLPPLLRSNFFGSTERELFVCGKGPMFGSWN